MSRQAGLARSPNRRKGSAVGMICDMEMEVDFDDLTEEDLWDYLTQKCSHQLKMSEAPMKSIFAEITLNMSTKDANSRTIDLWRQWYEVKEKYQVAADFATDKGKKLLRQSTVSKLWPANVKTRVFNKLRDVDAEAERIRNSDKEFFDYMVRIASEQERSFSFNGSGNKRSFEDYVDSDDEYRPYRARKLFKRGPRGGNRDHFGDPISRRGGFNGQGRGGYGRGRGGHFQGNGRGDHLKNQNWRFIPNPESNSNGGLASTSEGKSDQPPKTLKCYKCGGNHRVGSVPK